MAQGTWGIGNWKLPDLGITEALGIFKPNPAFAQSNTSSQTNIGPVPTPQPPSGVVYTPQYSGGQTFSTPNPPTYTSTPQGAAEQQAMQQSTAPQQSSSVSDGFSMDYYPGWGETEARADWIATGGAKAGGGGGGGGGAGGDTWSPTAYVNPYTGTAGATTQQSPNVPSKEQMLMSAYPEADLSQFDLTADDFMSEIESQYGERMSYLDKAKMAIEAGQPGILEGIAADLKAAQAKAGTAKTTEEGVLKGSEQEATTRKEDALAAARRLYDELRRGGVQRFGGASSAGEAMNTLLGVEQQKQMGQTQRDWGQTMDQINRQKLDIENQYQDQLLQLEADNTNAINQVNQEFRSRLDEINQNRLLASDAKSQARLGVLQELRDKAFQIQAQQQQFRQQLEMQKQQQQMDLDTYAQQLQMSSGYGQQATQQYLGATSTSPTSNITATGQQSTTPVGIGSAMGQIGDDDRTRFLQGAVSDKDLPLWMQR